MSRPESIRWIAAHDSPFGFEVLDCRPLSGSATSTSANPRVAAKFLSLRSSRGNQHRGRLPEEPFRVVCSLGYPPPPSHDEGPVFLATEMEDKWDLFMLEGLLYFARSWTGDLMLVAAFDSGPGDARIVSITAHSRQALGDAAFTTRAVDFLVKTHFYGLAAPHPLPAHYRDRPPEDLAAFSFTQFGRSGQFGTFEDTTRLRVVRGTSDLPGLRRE